MTADDFLPDSLNISRQNCVKERHDQNICGVAFISGYSQDNDDLSDSADQFNFCFTMLQLAQLLLFISLFDSVSNS